MLLLPGEVDELNGFFRRCALAASVGTQSLGGDFSAGLFDSAAELTSAFHVGPARLLFANDFGDT